MRFFFLGPRLFGVRPGVSFSPRDFRKMMSNAAPSSGSNVTGGFVYVLKDGSGRHKIGSSRDPIARIAQLQTGSAEHLDFAFIGAAPENAYTAIERAAHDLLEDQKIAGGGDEWFKVPASIAIGAVLEVASRLNLPIQQVQPVQVAQIMAVCRQQAAQGTTPGKHCGMFNAFPWYIRWPAVTIVGLVGGVGLALVIEAAQIIANAPPPS